MKKITLCIILAVVAVLGVASAMFGKKYYEERYVGTDYYAMVPMDFDLTPETLYDSEGKPQDIGKNYVLTAYNESGEAKEVDFTVRGEDTTKYPQPGDYLLVSVSKQLVVKQSIVSESSVPNDALAKIKENQ